jgi:hypothetical protein
MMLGFLLHETTRSSLALFKAKKKPEYVATQLLHGKQHSVASN